MMRAAMTTMKKLSKNNNDGGLGFAWLGWLGLAGLAGLAWFYQRILNHHLPVRVQSPPGQAFSACCDVQSALPAAGGPAVTGS